MTPDDFHELQIRRIASVMQSIEDITAKAAAKILQDAANHFNLRMQELHQYEEIVNNTEEENNV